MQHLPYFVFAKLHTLHLPFLFRHSPFSKIHINVQSQPEFYVFFPISFLSTYILGDLNRKKGKGRASMDPSKQQRCCSLPAQSYIQLLTKACKPHFQMSLLESRVGLQTKKEKEEQLYVVPSQCSFSQLELRNKMQPVPGSKVFMKRREPTNQPDLERLPKA